MPTTRTPGKSRRKTKTFELTAPAPKPELEADVLADVQTFLMERGWFVLRTFPGRWVPYGEFVAAIRAGRQLAFRIARPRTLHPESIPDLVALQPDRVLWIETKKPGKQPDVDQHDYHRKLRIGGYPVIWCDCLREGEGAEPFARSYKDLGFG